MVTRRAVLRGTAAASIGAIAAAHGAAPVEAATLGAGYGQLTGGAAGGFIKYRDAFQIAVKFDKISADIFFKEQGSEGVAIFFKFFQKQWETAEPLKLSSDFFKDLQTSELSFSKIETNSAEFFLKDPKNRTSVQATFEINSDGLFYKFDPIFDSDGEIL